MESLQIQIKKIIINSLNKLYSYDLDENNPILSIESPKDKTNGDYSTSIALRLAKQLHDSPANIAKNLKTELENSNLPLKEVLIAGPGFINFFIKSESLTSIIDTIIEQGDKYGYNESGKGQRILVEYVSANPTGDLHVGHAKGAAWGDSVTRLLKMSGYDCLREYYINDAGAQIDNLANSLISRYLELFNINKEMPQDGYYGEDIKLIAKDIYKQFGDRWVNCDENERFEFFKEEGKKRELAKIESILKEYRVEFDNWASEKTIRDSGKMEWVLKELDAKGLLYRQDNALWFKSSLFGDDKDRVLQKSDGLYTYLTPDIAYHLTKLERGYSKIVDLLGADHHGYVARMKAALNAFGYPKDCLEVDIIQMIRLLENGVEVKMSKRTGKAVTLRELIDDIGVDATRYFLCSRANDTHLDFDLTLAKTQSNENPVFYAQYAHARMCSIIKNTSMYTETTDYSLLNEQKEIELLKLISNFPKEVALAASNRAPHKICNYIQKLSSEFHSYYGSTKILNPNDKLLTSQRVALVKALRIALSNALNIIGVSSPEHM